jgi:DNA replication protein DnaC
MHLEQTLQQLREMRLSYMARSLEERLKNGDNRDLSHEEFIALLVEDEFNARKNRKLARMLSRANFKANHACIENIKYSTVRNLTKADIMPFSGESWITNVQCLILSGATGTGKTYIAEAIGRRACVLGYQAVKIRYGRLFEELHEARGMGMYAKYLDKLDKIKVLILDDFAGTDVSKKDLGDLVDILEDRDQKWPVIITSQYSVNKWHKRFPDPTLADAICDRLIHRSVKINLKGDSMRKNRGKSGGK